MFSAALQKRFWDKVEVRSGGQCWPWHGERNERGYGRLRSGSRYLRATHVAWSLANGREFPADKIACHRCDNPPCVNPGHIWPGTHGENLIDSFAKGRRPNVGYRAICVRCGHLRTDDYVERNGARKCRPCNLARGRKRSARRAVQSSTSQGA